MTAQRINLNLSPAQALAAWPVDAPLAALWSADVGQPASRWTVLSSPLPEGGAGGGLLVPAPVPSRTAVHVDATIDSPPFTRGWIGYVSYDHGRTLEPAVERSHDPHDRRAATDRDWPMMQWHRCDDALIFDNHLREWWRIGDPPALTHTHLDHSKHELGELIRTTSQADFESQVARVLDYIRAGDVYQVNLAHRLTAPFRGSARDLFLSLALAANPWYGAYLEHTHRGHRHAVASVSPELFIELDPATRRVATRPMKGTRAGTTAASAQSLSASTKDAAELNMIIDLMRNDLGRACELASVRVETARDIERHGDLLQTTARVTGTLRAGLTIADLMRAIFPGGSVTGAPKIRAMQIIDELEPVRRGPYCGAIGYISDSGHAAFNIAIRTALIHGEPIAGALDAIDGHLDYSVGAGIVADSDPRAEWLETLDKAGPILGLTRPPVVETAPPRRPAGSAT